MTRLWLGIYQLLLLTFGGFYLLSRLLKAKPLKGMRERLGWYSRQEKERLRALDGPVWLHLVSVGEAMAARPLVEELRRRFPQRSWLITTTTSSGRVIAQRMVRPGKDQILYLPWDLAPAVSRAVRAIGPRLFLSFETELWPVLFHALAREGVPVAVVNGRISPAAYRRYLWVRPLMERALLPVGMFLTQSPQDARRYAGIGAAMDRIAVTGNLKWDMKVAGHSSGSDDRLRGLLSLSPSSLVWTAGSTHAGEEEIIFQVYRKAKQEFPSLRLVIAPRHPEKTGQVEQAAARAGLASARWSALKLANQAQKPGAEPVLILDTVGDLALFYQISDVVFVGGSLVPHGGHNLVEPAALSRAIVTGPHLDNFQQVAEALAHAGGMTVVNSAEELEISLRRLLREPAARAELGRRARAVFQENQGATGRTAELIARRWGSSL